MQPKAILRVSKACDACRVRKVKCNGSQPCPACEHMNLHCKFSQHDNNGDKNPARSTSRRNWVLNQLRGEQNEGKRKSRTLRPALTTQTKPTNGKRVPATYSNKTEAAQETSSSKGLADSQLEEKQWIQSLIPLYETSVYVMNPIITCDEFRDSIEQMHSSKRDHTAFVYAAAAVAVFFAPLSSDVDSLPQDGSKFYCRSENERDTHVRRLASLCEIARSEEGAPGLDLSEPSASVRRIMTSIFFAVCLMGLGCKERAFCVVREAINMMQLISYDENDKEFVRKQRLYWQLFIHERFVCITMGLPPTLTHCAFPCPDSSMAPDIHAGFQSLCRLFSIMDGDFMRYWTQYQGTPGKMGTAFWNPDQRQHEITAAWIERKHQELDRDESNQQQSDLYMSRSPTGYENTRQQSGGCASTELQSIDLQITRLWIRTLLWQLAASRLLLNSVVTSSAHEAMSLTFPARRIVAQLKDHVSQLGNRSSYSAHGSGILDKLFEITNSIADVLLLIPKPDLGSFGEFEEQPRADESELPGCGKSSSHLLMDFNFVVEFLFSFERIDKVQRRIIEEKQRSLMG